jgi:hypothetical protein
MNALSVQLDQPQNAQLVRPLVEDEPAHIFKRLSQNAKLEDAKTCQEASRGIKGWNSSFEIVSKLDFVHFFQAKTLANRLFSMSEWLF